MTTLSKIEVELSEEEATALREVMESGDEDRITAEMQKYERVAAVRSAAAELRAQLMRDVILLAHHWLHEGDEEKALMLLCPMASILEGEMPPAEVILALTHALNAGNIERAKHSCAGNA